ncbi:hypothetical protein OT109_14760 [Phycisphaeraceae bacterium D3-23]
MKYVLAVLLTATLLGILQFHPHYVRARAPKAGGAGVGHGHVIGDIAVMRNAIQTYADDHAGTYPTLVDLQSGVLTRKHTCPAGDTHGPYLRRPIAAVFSGSIRIADINRATPDDGWAYDETSGELLLIVSSQAEFQDLGYGPSAVMIAPKP